AFLRRLSEFASDSRYDKKTRYKFNYNALRNNPYMKKTTKHYLWNHVRTSFLNITADEMPIAIFLPVARFVGATEQSVWRRA
ncbi:MAG: hypothetical protein QF704_16990, partial [Anaerolineales bacterium]|nr:hypothetical protein [Anaerolineales bacterium]